MTIQSPPSTSIQINSSLEPSLKEILNQLFNEAMMVANDKTVEIVKNLLPDL